MRHHRLSPILVAISLAAALLACQLNALQPAPTPTRTLAATATRTVTRSFTATSLPLPATPIPATPTAAPVTVNATAKDNLRVRAAPSTSAAVLDRLNKGDTAQVVGRTAASDWLQIALPTKPGQLGWISTGFVTLSGPLDVVPIVQAQGRNPPVPVPPAPKSYPYP